jgi:serine/threonine-protein kinase
MGEVYRADDLKLGQSVALKFLPAVVESDPERLQRFLNEVKIARQISHPNVCRVYDVGEVDGHHYLSMEYVDGEDLASLLRRIGRLPGDKAIQIARQLCAGLAAAHDKGVLHRDLKPANVMLDGEGRVRITDFGLAAIVGQVTGAEVNAGTPAYMAPEQVAGKEVSVASDIFSLGIVLFELFTGKPVFKADSAAELQRLHQENRTSPSSFVPDLDPAVERVILRCLSRHPAERPTSALAVAAALPGGDPLAAALAGYGFHTAFAGRPLFGESLLQE